MHPESFFANINISPAQSAISEALGCKPLPLILGSIPHGEDMPRKGDTSEGANSKGESCLTLRVFLPICAFLD